AQAAVGHDVPALLEVDAQQCERDERLHDEEQDRQRLEESDERERRTLRNLPEQQSEVLRYDEVRAAQHEEAEDHADERTRLAEKPLHEAVAEEVGRRTEDADVLVAGGCAGRVRHAQEPEQLVTQTHRAPPPVTCEWPAARRPRRAAPRSPLPAPGSREPAANRQPPWKSRARRRRHSAPGASADRARRACAGTARRARPRSPAAPRS